MGATERARLRSHPGKDESAMAGDKTN